MDDRENNPNPVPSPLASIAAQRAMDGLLPPSAAFEDGDTTTYMHFPRMVTLTLPSHRRVQYQPGVNPVPTRLADHWYLKAAGARAPDAGFVPPPTVEQVAEASGGAAGGAADAAGASEGTGGQPDAAGKGGKGGGRR